MKKLLFLQSYLLVFSVNIYAQNITVGVPQPLPINKKHVSALVKLTEQEVRIAEIQAALVQQGFDGWLFYDFRGSDILTPRILKTERLGGSRRWFYFIPKQGEPVKVVHAIEPGQLDSLPGK